MNARYSKYYTRENSLIAFEVWEEHQCRLLCEKLGDIVPFSVFEVHGGVAKVYYHIDIEDIWYKLIAAKAEVDSNFVPDTMKWYENNIIELERYWNGEKVIKTPADMVTFFNHVARTWVGVSISYCLPNNKYVTKEDQDLGMKLRERSVDFLDRTDAVILAALRKLYPELGELVKYLSIKEIESDKIPSKDILCAREKHYRYHKFIIYTDPMPNLHDFARQNGIEIVEEQVPASLKELKGQIAMKGKVTGVVRVLRSKKQIPELQKDEILVTAMTTPDYLPAMKIASAFITDEGGVTCHAAIVAREFGKPCIIGTKIATEVLKDGDRVEIDADNGVVKLIT